MINIKSDFRAVQKMLSVILCMLFIGKVAAQNSNHIIRNNPVISKKDSDKAVSGNPVFNGWYADPHAAIYNNKYWIFPTYSAEFNKQVFLDCFSSDDLVTWKKYDRILDTSDIKWAKSAMWAPASVYNNGKYYYFFAANDVHQGEIGGIGVAVADKPEGPYKDLIGKPLINTIVNGAQPIDQFVFKDNDGSWYMYYGGWNHCNLVKLNDQFTGLLPFSDGSFFKEVTPNGYVEGSFLFKRKGMYYFMWSEGNWANSSYTVAYGISDSPFGPFERIGSVLQQDSTIGKGAGHQSVINIPGTDKWYFVYHRRPVEETEGNSRVVCIEEMTFDHRDLIEKIKISRKGVKPNLLTRQPASISTNHTNYLKAILGFPLGVATDFKSIRANNKIRNLVQSEFASITPENSMKFERIQPQEGQFVWSHCDSLVAFAQQNNMRIHGHTLCWHHQYPSWIKKYAGNKEKVESLLKQHIQTVVKHYKGKIKSWDVVNEAFEDNGTLRKSFFQENIDDYIAKCFQWAREADPDALLFYNDYGQENYAVKLAAILKMVEDFKNRGVPIDGIGLQMHTSILASDTAIVSSIRKSAATGLQIHISELDVSVNPWGDSTMYYSPLLKLQQTAKFALIFKTYKDYVPKQRQYGITMWSVGDTDTWLRSSFKKIEWPTLFDDEYKRKSVYDNIFKIVNQKH